MVVRWSADEGSMEGRWRLGLVIGEVTMKAMEWRLGERLGDRWMSMKLVGLG